MAVGVRLEVVEWPRVRAAAPPPKAQSAAPKDTGGSSKAATAGADKPALPKSIPRGTPVQKEDKMEVDVEGKPVDKRGAVEAEEDNSTEPKKAAKAITAA